VAGTSNFYAITRYNWSSYYAMAVIELGREVKVVMAAKAAMGSRATPPQPPAENPPVSPEVAPAAGPD
jgi:membrane-bound lytic murein transglycosylase B